VNCDEAEELLGAYALDALPDGEASAMRAHLVSCADHAARVAELRAVALQLPALADSIPAPAGLRARVLGAIEQESATRQSAPRSIGDAPRKGAEARVLWRPTNIRNFSTAWGAIAAALVITVGGLLAWNLVLQNRSGASVERLASRATTVATLKQASGGVGGTVVYFGDDKKALVVSGALAPLDSTKTYQMWAVGGAQPTSIGVMNAGLGGTITAVVPFDATRTGTLAITIEPAGGSTQPTTAPILTASCISAPSSDCAS
jgi:anti-sigma-K factor RskA